MTLNASGIQAYGQSGSIVNLANGGYTGDGSGAINVNVGFTPRWVKVIDFTGVVVWEWVADLPATIAVKTVTGGTTTMDTNSAIVTNGAQVTVTEVASGVPGAQGPGEGTQGTVSVTYDNPNLALPQLTFGSALNVNAHVYSWVAQG